MLRFVLGLALALPLSAQSSSGIETPPSGNNQRAKVMQSIGPVHISIEYSSPAVHTANGQDRRGQIWGKLVPYGLTDLGFGNRKPAPWRGGANENTVFTTSDAIDVEGKRLPAGRYGLFLIAGPEEWTVIFSKDSNAWGSFYYEAEHDVLRVPVKPHKHDYREYLSYEFPVRKPDSAVAEMQWEDLAVPWTIQVPNVSDLYFAKIEENLTNVPGFTWRGWAEGAQFCATANTHLDKALEWAETAISKPGIGEANFTTLSTKALILNKLGRKQESAAAMDLAVHNPTATALDIHQYGRTLIAAKDYKTALEIFQYNAQRYPDQWPVHVGLARGFSATGDLKQALDHARKALAQAPDPLNKQSLEAIVKDLEAGHAISQ